MSDFVAGNAKQPSKRPPPPRGQARPPRHDTMSDHYEITMDEACPHDSVDTFASGAGRRVDVCMGCRQVVRFWNVNDRLMETNR